jgi:dTDP-glucose 4,6-dehydratase
MHLLVTGGAGFIGSNFVNMFFRGDFPLISKITILDKLTYAGNLENLKESLSSESISFVNGDITDFDVANRLVSQADGIINFAAESHVDRSIENSSDFIRTNIVGVQTLLESARFNEIGKFLQVSTDEVYGSIEFGSWDEECSLLPNSPYAASKAAADLLVRSYANTHSLATNITRCSNNYGPNQYPEKIIPSFIKKIINREPVPVYGNGLNIRDWLYVEDHCRAIYLTYFFGVTGEIYNVGGGKELTNLELVRLILTVLEAPESLIEFVPDRKGHDFRYSVDWSKIQLLGYAPKADLQRSLVETIENYAQLFSAK